MLVCTRQNYITEPPRLWPINDSMGLRQRHRPSMIPEARAKTGVCVICDRSRAGTTIIGLHAYPDVAQCMRIASSEYTGRVRVHELAHPLEEQRFTLESG